MGKVYEGLIKPCIFWDGNSSYYHVTNCVNKSQDTKLVDKS